MAPEARSNDSGRKKPRGSAPAGTPTASLAGAPEAPLRSADSLAPARSFRTPRGSAPAGTPTASLAGTPRLAAIKLLGRRDYTSHEIRTKLIDKGYAVPEVEAAIARLAGEGSLDDRRVAAGHVRAAAGLKGRGRHRIKRELAARGISRTIAEEALKGLEAKDESATIRRILQRKRYPARPSVADKRRMFQHLMRRGFDADTIQRALRYRDDEDGMP